MQIKNVVNMQEHKIIRTCFNFLHQPYVALIDMWHARHEEDYTLNILSS